jgi:uncharacterized protein HemX
MIDFSTQQLTWVLVTALGLGGTGYMNLNSKVDELDKKLAVSVNTTENMEKSMSRLEQQLNRIEQKITPVTKR